MTREHVMVILGILVLISPWSGFPLEWLTWILPIIGLAVVAIGISLRPRTNTLPPSLPEVPAVYTQEPEPRSSHIAFS